MLSLLAILAQVSAPAAPAAPAAESFFAQPLFVWAVTAVISAAVSIAVTWGGQRERMKVLSDATGSLQAAVGGLRAAISDAKVERAECAADCARAFTTRAEMARLISDQTVQSQRIHGRLDAVALQIDDKLSKIHERVNVVSQDVAALRGVKEVPA